MKMRHLILLTFLLLVFVSMPLIAAEKSLTIIHTNDIHSHLLGSSPNRDYTPMTTRDDETLGGFARIATVIKSEMEKRENTVLVLDAGDFLMGTLFHMISRDEAVELTLMKKMGYDVTTLGNHEFDLRPSGLARIIESAASKGEIPLIVSSNVVFDEEDDRDDSLEEVFEKGLVLEYTVLERDGMKIGFFGLMGKDADDVAPFASPVKFGDQIEAARRMVEILRETEEVDIVICLSHSGLWEDEEKSEDEILAKEVPGIDIIISGHTHTKLLEPIIINDTIIVQAWCYGKWVGVLDVNVGDDGVSLVDYEIIEINDSIEGDREIQAEIESYIGVINARVLKEYGLTFDGAVAETDFDLVLKNEEVGLGNLVTDAIRWATNYYDYDPADPMTRVRMTLQSNGVIREDILIGETGLINTSDIFKVVPLGIGVDDTMGYPLVTFYLYASEIKKAMEVTTTIYPMKGSDYFLQISGLKFTYNPYRMLFDRVTEILIEDENGDYVPLDYSSSNEELYKVATNYYNASFIKFVGGYSYNILTMVPKDRDGNPIDDLSTARVDIDKFRPGIQELKDWAIPIEYIMSFEDRDMDGLPEIPDRYKTTEERIVCAPSLNPIKLLKRGTYVTWIAFAVICFLLILAWFIIYIPIRIIRRKGKA